MRTTRSRRPHWTGGPDDVVDRATEWVVFPSSFLSLFLMELRAGRTGVS
ncbi:hypothetical protein [Streptomyces sp. NPDC002671]